LFEEARVFFRPTSLFFSPLQQYRVNPKNSLADLRGRPVIVDAKYEREFNASGARTLPMPLNTFADERAMLAALRAGAADAIVQVRG
jgi:ABC-type amino acid transport substrate-binding protein